MLSVVASLTLWCFVVYSARRLNVYLTSSHFVLVFFSPFSIAITSLGEERANLSAFRMFDRFVLVWICRFPLPLDVWQGLQFVIVALPGLFSYLFCMVAMFCNCDFPRITLHLPLRFIDQCFGSFVFPGYFYIIRFACHNC